jgi:hypothetical protein
MKNHYVVIRLKIQNPRAKEKEANTEAKFRAALEHGTALEALEEATGHCLELVTVRATNNTQRQAIIRELAADEYHKDGSIEIDTFAEVSEGDENGAYVQAWVWVSFEGHDTLDKKRGRA